MNGVRAFSRCVCNQFAKMVVISIFKLIFYNDFTLGTGFCCENINVKITDLRFGFIYCDF